MLTYEQYIKNIEQLNKDKEHICKLIDKYLMLNFNKYFRIKRRIGSGMLQSKEHYLGCYNFSEQKTGDFLIEFKQIDFLKKRSKSEIYLDNEDFIDLKKFLNDPELYISTNKYNI